MRNNKRNTINKNEDETEEKAKRFCYKRNTTRPYRFHYEEWEVGEVIDGV